MTAKQTNTAERVGTEFAVAFVARVLAGAEGRVLSRRGSGRPRRRGMTLVEVMMALVILTITSVGSGAFFYQAFGMIETYRSKRLALDIASARLDRLQSAGTNYADVADTSETGLTIGQWPATLSTQVTERFDAPARYKEVKVTVSWIKDQQNHQVSLESIVGKK